MEPKKAKKAAKTPKQTPITEGIEFNFGDAPKVPGYYIRIWIEDNKGPRWGYFRIPEGPLAGQRAVFPDGDTALSVLIAAKGAFEQARLEPADRPANIGSATVVP